MTTSRLDLALIRLHPDLSRRRARDVIEKGQVSVDGRTVTEAGLAVGPQARIVFNPNLPARRRLRCALPLLYEDESLLIVDKPAGLLSVPTHPEAEDEDSALARVQAYVQRLRPRRPYVGAVHRLDRDTSGALAFALDPHTRSAMRALFRLHHIERLYDALVVGVPEHQEGSVELPLADVYVAGRRRVARADEEAHSAVTYWRVRERLGAATRLDVALDTGRQHQIRVHLAHLGLPILGDLVYAPAHAGRGLGVGAPRQMLHARLLAFTHPHTAAAVRVESPLPKDFEHVLFALRRAAFPANAADAERLARGARPRVRSLPVSTPPRAPVQRDARRPARARQAGAAPTRATRARRG
jgi:23S rRNA pseudouridine1911/1915/1917 synthase